MRKTRRSQIGGVKGRRSKSRRAKSLSPKRSRKHRSRHPHTSSHKMSLKKFLSLQEKWDKYMQDRLTVLHGRKVGPRKRNEDLILEDVYKKFGRDPRFKRWIAPVHDTRFDNT